MLGLFKSESDNKDDNDKDITCSHTKNILLNSLAKIEEALQELEKND
jgi:hypothetical protein